jgi:hypothetical protein
MRQQPLTTPGCEASQGCGPKQEKGPKSGALVQARPNSVVILWVLFRSVMPSSPPGCWQRGRTGLAVVACALLWGVRWLWPLQFVPGLLAVSFVMWVGPEFIALLRHPCRWR